MAEIQRASVFAIKEESTVGELTQPAAAGDFVPLRSGFTLESGLEELDSDELVNSIGSSKSTVGKESPSGAHNAYLKHSQVEGQAPEVGLLIESSLGGKDIISSEQVTDSGSTTSQIEVAGAGGSNYQHGHAVLVKDPSASNGYSIRNVSNVSGDSLSLNFNLDSAPASSVSLGKPILYYPQATGHKSYSSFLYSANGAAIQAVAGCRTSSISMTMASGQFAEINFSYAGSQYFFNPVVVDASNNKIDFTDDIGAVVATLSNAVYKTPVNFAAHVASVMTQASVGSGNDAISVSYSSITGKYTLSSDGSTFELDFSSGPNTANTSAGILGFAVADETGATSYSSDNAIDLSAPFTPDFDDADNIVVKSAQLFIGDADDNFCREASTVSFSIETPPSDVDDICAESGVKEKLILSRVATMSTTLTLKKYEVDLFSKYINGESAPIMMNIGPKSGGNFVAGKSVNIYFANATINTHTISGDDFIVVELSAKGYVTGDKKEVFINFI